jgi:hypothetical protein
MDVSPEYRAACCRMNTLRGFYRHLMFFLLINGALLIVNLLLDPAELQAIWPLSIWGIVLLGHGIVTVRRERRQCRAARAGIAAKNGGTDQTQEPR